ncbi:MAG TPA: hypothetical protein VFE46_14505 [Pirellulales bacterium]|jgi:hypothetical protein|nr:hypothetical protein [Pirellulales bacterium]
MSLEPEIESKGLAVLIVDALMTAGLLPRQHLDHAISIATEEISVRKAADDYWCADCRFRHDGIYPAN